MSMQKQAVIAVDVGGTKTSVGLVLGNGTILFEKTIPTRQVSADDSIDQIAGLIEDAVAQSPRSVVAAGVGLVIPGWVNHRARTVWAPNIAGWDHIPLQKRLEDRMPLPVVLEADRSGYVKGEAWLGVARRLNDVIFLALGTGIGAGILVGGQVVNGHDDLAGAVGWLALNPVYREPYRQMGCFEAEASGASIGRKGMERGGATYGSARAVLCAAAAGDEWSVKLLDEAVVYLGMGVANLVSMLNPEMVVLGGGVFQKNPELLGRIRDEFRRWAQPFAAERVRIEMSSLGEQAGLFGAARIALDNFGGSSDVS